MRKYFIIFAVCWIIFLIHAIIIRHAIYGDGGGYYVYTQALFFDKGLNFGPVYNFMNHFQGIKGEFSRILWHTSYNPYPIGTGLIWIPSVALTSIFFPDRFSLVYEIGPGLTGIILVLAGLYFLEKYLQNFFSKKIATISVLIFFLTSNLFYYTSFEPALAHQPAFFLVSFLLFFTYKMKPKLINYILTGALSGLLFTVRVADSVLLIPIFIQLLKEKPNFKYLIIYAVSALVLLIPLAWSYNIMLGSPFKMPYIVESAGNWSFALKDIVDFFITPKRGLFTWSPVYIFGFWGLLKTKRYDFMISLTVFILIICFWASVSVAFGQRFILSGVPYLIFGFAKFIEKINLKWILILFIVLFFWNLLTIFDFYTNKADLIKNDSLTMTQFLKSQFTSPIKALEYVKKSGINNYLLKKVLY